MATSTFSYRRTTNLKSRADDSDTALRSKLEQARQQRTAFYRRLAETGARAQTADDGAGLDVDVDVDSETSMRRRHRLSASSPSSDGLSSTYTSLMEPLPEPRSSWRYYTSYDNGEWRRHATPIYHADAELEAGKATDRHSVSARAALSTHDDIIDIEDAEGSSSHSRPGSAQARQQRLRGSAWLTRDLPSAAASSDTDTGPTTLEEVKMVMKDVFDRSRYGSNCDVSELVQKILSERQRDREPSPAQTEDRIIYANPDRRTILDNVTQSLRPTLPEIPEGSDEKDFVEKTLAPSGRPWTSSSSSDSQRIFIVRELFGEDGLQYEEIGTGAAGTSLENWRDSSCCSLSNVPDTQNGEGERARWTVPTAGGGRTVVTSETTRHRQNHTVTEAPQPPPTLTTKSGKDTFGRRIPADAVEIKVEMQRGDSDKNEQYRRDKERNSPAVEQWLHSFSDSASPASHQRSFVDSSFVKSDEKLSNSSAVRRHEHYSDQVKDGGTTPRTSSGDGWSKDTGTKSVGKTVADDGRIWIPVMHVSGTAASKSEATKSDARPSPRSAEREERAVDITPTDAGRREGGFSSKLYIDNVSPARQSCSESRQTQHVGEAAASAHQSSSLRTGSGVGSYGFRSSIVVDRGLGRGSQLSSTGSSDATQQAASDGDWVVERAV